MATAFPNSIHFNYIPTNNISLKDTNNIFGKNGNTLNSLASTKYWKVDTDVTKGITGFTFPASNQSLGSLAGSWREPYFTVTGTGSYVTLGASPVGFPTTWVAGDIIGGYIAYGYASGQAWDYNAPNGSISAGGSLTGTNGDKLTNTAGTKYYIRQWMYNTSRSQGCFRISYTSALAQSPPTTLITGISFLRSGTVYPATLSAGVQQVQGTDYSTYWTYTAGLALPSYTGSVSCLLSGL